MSIDLKPVETAVAVQRGLKEISVRILGPEVDVRYQLAE